MGNTQFILGGEQVLLFGFFETPTEGMQSSIPTLSGVLICCAL